MSDTPRVDALGKAWAEADRKYGGMSMRLVQPDDPQDIWDFARDLEREINDLRRQLSRSVPSTTSTNI